MRPHLEDMRPILTHREIKVASAPHVSHQTFADTQTLRVGGPAGLCIQGVRNQASWRTILSAAEGSSLRPWAGVIQAHLHAPISPSLTAKDSPAMT